LDATERSYHDPTDRRASLSLGQEREAVLRDPATFGELGLFSSDTFQHVRVLDVVGWPANVDATRIEIFARVAE
jgi:hypothetical protein